MPTELLASGFMLLAATAGAFSMGIWLRKHEPQAFNDLADSRRGFASACIGFPVILLLIPQALALLFPGQGLEHYAAYHMRFIGLPTGVGIAFGVLLATTAGRREERT